jgi:hypothetical protein
MITNAAMTATATPTSSVYRGSCAAPRDGGEDCHGTREKPDDAGWFPMVRV